MRRIARLTLTTVGASLRRSEMDRDDAKNATYWVIKHDDAEEPDMVLKEQNNVLTEEEIRSFYTDRLDNWNCHLFRQVSNNGKATDEATAKLKAENKRLKGEIEKLGEIERQRWESANKCFGDLKS